MGQQRTDTAIQIAAKVRGAENRRCPSCGRGNAMGARMVFTEERDGWRGRARVCRYCDYELVLRWLDDGSIERSGREGRGK